MKKREQSTHHVWPKEWYHGSGPTAEVCVTCHREFEKLNPHNFVWTVRECEKRWADFCLRKKNEATGRYNFIDF